MEETNETSKTSETSEQPKTKGKNIGGRPLGVIWNHFHRKETVGPGKFGAECKYCFVPWKRGEIPILEEHLANHCSNEIK
ncbi:hypothetical protein Glove_166g182 [Diversispora epigaea]|uniref:BED-type domain-containing protein n=1 Tax=Diversispora epigaea TaxID=1348612 RepID=A0A397IV68_9GLOM|nr:hypothetical protein Glove_166g182 [Diversispora epigaea]